MIKRKREIHLRLSMTIKKFKTIRFLLTKTVQGAHHERKITPYLYNLQVCIISTTSPEIRRKHQPSPHQNMLTSIRRNHKLSNRRIAKFSSGYESSRSTSRDSATDNSEKSSTPYRLPKLLLDSDDGFVEKESEVKEVEQIFGRFGYEYVVRLPELKPLTPAEIISPQRLLSQRYRQVSLVPRLRTAEILPEYRHTPSLERENRSITDDVISPHSLEQNSQSDRTMTARSNSVQWKLGQGNNGVFDITGQSNVQGPFSRSFKVRCRAPPSWMRMKWGRSKTMIL